MGEEIILVDVEHDKYAGRVIASVPLADGRDLTEVLIEIGHGRPYDVLLPCSRLGLRLLMKDEKGEISVAGLLATVPNIGASENSVAADYGNGRAMGLEIFGCVEQISRPHPASVHGSPISLPG